MRKSHTRIQSLNIVPIDKPKSSIDPNFGNPLEEEEDTHDDIEENDIEEDDIEEDDFEEDDLEEDTFSGDIQDIQERRYPFRKNQSISVPGKSHSISNVKNRINNFVKQIGEIPY